MGRDIIGDLRVGGASSAEVLRGTISIEPTMLRRDGAKTVLPEPSVTAVSNGVFILENVDASPDGPEPEWAYKMVIRNTTTGRAFSLLLGVPAGTEPINFNTLPVFGATIPPGATVEDMQNWADFTEANANRAEAAADRAEAPTDAMLANLAGDDQSLTGSALGNLFTRKPSLLSRLRTPTIIAHRGARNLYPEQSLEGLRAAVADGYLPEVDVRALADGTLICLHDAQVDRTMTGRTGFAIDLTLEEWMAMRIRPAMVGGRDALPYLLDDFLDEFGGRIPLVIELKHVTEVNRDKLANAILSRSLQDSVVLQTDNWGMGGNWAGRGLQVLYLFNGAPPYSATEIKDKGFNYVGVGGSTTAATISQMRAAGLTVWAYTINTPAAYHQRLSDGVHGVFSDDPWRITRRHAITTGDPFHTGFGWPGMRGHYEVGTTLTDYPVRLSGNALDLYQIGGASSEHKTVYMEWAGALSIPFRASMRIRFGDAAIAQGNSVGMIFHRNTVDPDADFLDGAKPGQEGFTMIARRSGQLSAWKYEAGAASSSLLASTPSKVFAEPGVPGEIELVVTATASTITMAVPTYGIVESAGHAYNPGGPLRFSVRGTNGMAAEVSDIRIKQL